MIRDVLVQLVSVQVADADFEGVEGGENVELGDGDLRQGIQSHSMTEQDQVQPSRPATATSVGPVFMSELDEHVPLFAGYLGGHGAGTDPGHVRLGDTDNPVDVPRPDPRADAGAA